MDSTMYKIELDTSERDALLSLLDEALKAKGLSVVHIVAHFSNKLLQAVAHGEVIDEVDTVQQ